MADESMVGEVKEDPSVVRRKTLFVRNLPFTTTDGQLEEAFGDCGPIKRCFVVKDRDKSKGCRGFGYIVFAISEDAAKALDSEIVIGGRKVLVSLADKKPRQRDNYKPKNAVDKDIASENQDENTIVSGPDEGNDLLRHKRTKVPEVNEKEEAKRTIVISGLPDEFTKTKLKLLCSKHGKVQKILPPSTDKSSNTSTIIFKSIKGAVRAFQKINGSKVGENVLHSCLLTKEGKQPSRKVLDKSQLIVRNISYKCKEDDLKNAFSKFGKILRVELPTITSEKGRTRMKGFAFVQFLRPEDANSAMEGLNKKQLLSRPMIIDWAIPKDEFLAKSEDHAEVVGKANKPAIMDARKQNKDDTKISGYGKIHGGQGEDDDDDDDVDVASGNDETEDETGSEADDVDEQSERESAEESDDDDDDDEDEETSDEDNEIERQYSKVVRKQSHDAKEGRTVFIRNLPFEASEEELVELVSEFGPVEDCKLVIDKETGHSRGTAFVKFKDIGSVEKVVSASDDIDPKEGGITLSGRRLFFVKAVTRGKVKEIEKEKKNAKKDPKDKRNLALATEGAVFPNSEAAKELSEADMKKREKAWADKKTKLKNQNYFVSKTRLSIRNLPLSVNENEMRKAFLEAVNKSGIKIKKILIMRNKDRLDNAGKCRSLGYGFMELETHEQALAMLRATNNNPGVFGDDRRLIVEFSVENKAALELQEKRRERQKQKTVTAKGDSESGGKKLNTKDEKLASPEKFKNPVQGRESKQNKGMKSKEGKNFDNKGKRFGKQKGDSLGKKQEGRKQSIGAKQLHQSNAKSWGKKDQSEKQSFTSRNQRQSQDGSRKRKGNGDVQDESKAGKVPKRRRTDLEEKKFSSLVNKYKSKLFGENASLKEAPSKRWFE